MSLMQPGQKFTPNTMEAEYGESTVQPNPVDINDFCSTKAMTESYTGLKPSLKPLKKSSIKKRDNSRELDLEALEASHKKIIYIKTFNHVKNEAIVEYPEPTSTKNIYRSASQDMQSLKHGPKKKKRNLPPPIDLTFFRQNQKKFNPLKKIKKKEPVQPAESNPADDDLVFLTGLNIQEPKKKEEDEEEEVEEEEQNNYKPRFLREWPKNEDTPEESQRGTEPAKPTVNERESTNLPTLKNSGYTSYDKPHVSVSEARYQRYMNSKPKMYITAKTNSVQAFGRPANYKDHLARVYSKEATPTVQYPLVDHLGPKKDIRKVVLDTYLAQYNVEALREIDEDLYEYAKQKGY